MYLRVQDPINLNTKIEFIKIDLKLYFKIYLVCFVFAIETIKRNLVVGAFIDDYCKVESDFDFEIKPTGNIVPRLECRWNHSAACKIFKFGINIITWYKGELNRFEHL